MLARADIQALREREKYKDLVESARAVVSAMNKHPDDFRWHPIEMKALEACISSIDKK